MEEKYTGNCHCKAICFEFYCSNVVDLIKCNCSICNHTKFLHLIVPHRKFNLLKGKELLVTYMFNTKLAKHFFCSVCGIKSFYQPRSHQDSFSINFHSILSPPKINKVIAFDGKNFEKNLKDIRGIDH